MHRIFSKEEVRNILVAEYDYDTDIAVQRAEAGRIAFAEGREQGITQGSRQKALETAKTMLTMHYPFEIFVRFQDFRRRKYGRLVICNAGIRQENCEKVAAF